MRRLSEILKNEYGEKIYKIALSSGCTCPNRDGTAGTGGCAFCSQKGSGDFAAPTADLDAQIDVPTDLDAQIDVPADLDAQIDAARKLISRKTNARRFIAYFQSFTNTYGDVRRLEELYTKALRRDDIAILSLGTRPDCLGPEVMAMLCRLNQIKPVWVELGLQTIRDDIADAFNRCYRTEVFDEAHRRLKEAGLTTVVHVIFGLPGESRQDMLDTIRHLAQLDPPPDGIKIQMLHVMRGTRLGEQYLREPFPLLTLEEYAQLVVESLQILPDDIILHRMTGDAPWALLIAPEWSRDKKRVLNTLNRAIGGGKA